MSLGCVHVCSYLGACVDGGAVMFKNITSYLGECRCGVCACVCVLTCACVEGGAIMFKNTYLKNTFLARRMCRCLSLEHGVWAYVCVCMRVRACVCASVYLSLPLS